MENKIKINDIVLNYFDNQNQQKPIVIMLHGWGQSFQCFMPLIEKLNKKFSYLCPRFTRIWEK